MGSSKETPLIKAAINGHHEVIQTLIDAGADIEQTDSIGYTPLMWAIFFTQKISQSNHVKSIRQLLNSCADVNKYNAILQGTNPLTRTRCADVAKLLIECGADPNKQSKEGTTPLHGASREGNAELVKILIQGGGDPYRKDKRKRTPLQMAEYYGKEEA